MGCDRATYRDDVDDVANARAVMADIEFDVDLDVRVRLFARVRKLRYRARIVHANADLRAGITRRQLGKLQRLAVAHDFIGDQDVGDTTREKRFGFGGLLAANTYRTRRYLPARNLDALVALGMWTHAHPASLYRARQPRKVCFEPFEIKDQRWCINVRERVTDTSRNPLIIHTLSVSSE